MTMRSVVVLPAPFGPSRPKMLSRGTSSERSFTATWPAKAFRMPLSTRALSFTEPPSGVQIPVRETADSILSGP